MKHGRTTPHNRTLAATIVCLTLTVPKLAAAAEPASPATPVAAAGATEPNDARKAEAARRFDRALKLFEAGDNAGALAEFKRTYEVLADPVVLYNMGLVYAAMARPVDAVDALEPLVRNGQLPQAQLERAKQTLADQAARIGRLTVTTTPSDARIEIDGIQLDGSTMSTAPIRVAEGKHVVGAVAEGYAPTRKEIFIAGNSDLSLALELVPTQGKQLANVTVTTRLTGTEVYVDGTLVGMTPLPTSLSLPPGRHQVELRRAGYITERREVTVGAGATADISVNLAVDPVSLAREGVALVIDASEAPFEVTVDGERKGVYTGPLRLPRGAHRLTIASPGFFPLEQDITLGGTQSTRISAKLEPLPETRAAYESNARAHRTWGLVGLMGGVAVAAGGAVLAVIESGKKSDAQEALDDITKKFDEDVPPCDSSRGYAPSNDDGALCRKTISDAKAELDRAKTLRTLGFVGIGVGSATAVTGIVLWLTGNDPDRYARKSARSRLVVVPGPGDFGTGFRLSF